MKKMLLVLALVAVFSLSASAKTSVYSFTFRDTAGNAYCDGLTLYLYGTPKTLVDGTHNNDNCAGAFTGVNGFKGSVSYLYQYNGTGAVLMVSDPILASTGVMWLVNTTYSNWTAWESGAGAGEFVVTYGTFVNGTAADKKGTKAALGR